MFRSRFITASLAAAALIAAAVVPLDASGAAAATTAVSVWETTADQSQLLAPHASTRPRNRRQTADGDRFIAVGAGAIAAFRKAA